MTGDLKSKKSSTAQIKKVRLKKIKSRELYGGTVYIDCDCYHRNGLQHDCPRSSCGGPPCRVKPWPECDLGTYFIDKWEKHYQHLDRIPPTSFCGSKEEWIEILEKEERELREKRQELERQKKNSSAGVKSDDTLCYCLEEPSEFVEKMFNVPYYKKL
ncbi:hypothetical protein WH47_07846 [Habropoda laboriosa]|uniref:Uncharacterized protein n=1 Tax=Habropoda laboriosa TaxID=597456 RepID=A0A0L7QPC2_9HYME|nr:hypothetical protein WH47_07846 [Habropoda laboriosa]